MIDFPEVPGYPKETLKKVQGRLLEMAKSICSILEKNDIPYMLAVGTLLGAVRHQGFIPWDDDFDIFIFDDVYEDAIKCLRKESYSFGYCFYRRNNFKWGNFKNWGIKRKINWCL